MTPRWSLARSLRTVAFKDRQAFRQQMFAYLASHDRTVRSVLAVHKRLRGTPLSAAALTLYGLRAYAGMSAPRPSPIWAVSEYRNERRQFDALRALVPQGIIGDLGVGKRDALTLESLRSVARLLTHRGALRSLWRLVRRHDRDDGFLVAARTAACFGRALRTGELLDRHGAKAVLVSSDSNPPAMGAIAAARARGLKVAYVTHGHLPEGPPPLDVDLALLDGPALLGVYERAGPVRARVVFKGAEGDYRPLATAGLGRPAPVLGVFMSILVDWPRAYALLGRLRAALRPRRIVLRLHPNTVIRDPASRRLVPDWPELVVSDGATILTDDAGPCDLVIAGSSSCHLTLLRYGVPTAVVRGLDAMPHDFYRFVESRIVPELSPDSPDLAGIGAFYADPSWRTRFRGFDATYPTTDGGDPDDPAPALRAALAELLA